MISEYVIRNIYEKDDILEIYLLVLKKIWRGRMTRQGKWVFRKRLMALCLFLNLRLVTGQIIRAFCMLF